MRQVLKTILILILIAGIGYLLVITNRKYRTGQYRGVDISVLSGGEDSLLTIRQVTHLLGKEYDSLTHRSLDEISLTSIEQTLRQSPFIRDVDVYVTMTRKLKIKVISFDPLIRVMVNRYSSFYIDHSGRFVPVNRYHPIHILPVSGNIRVNVPDSSLHNNLHFKAMHNFSVIEEIFNLAKRIDENRFLKAQVDQVYRTDNGEYKLVPKVGNHLIIFGTTSLMDKKLKKLEAIYKQAIPKTGWRKYETINLKYKNQVVCSK